MTFAQRVAALLLLAFALLGASTSQALEAPTCTPQHCEHDPKKLEQFVKDFYDWYYAFATVPQYSYAPWQEAGAQATLKQVLTPEMYAGLDDFSFEHGLDELVQSGGMDEYYEHPNIIRLVSQQKNEVRIKVGFSGEPDSIPYPYYVILKPSQGQWRIAAVQNTFHEKVPPVNTAAIKELKKLEPVPVVCSSTYCDRNPKHLEQFVTDFYRWYIHGWENDDYRYDLNVLRQILTLSFQHSFYKFSASTETNPILCAQDILPNMDHMILTSIEHLENTRADFVVHFSTDHDLKGKLAVYDGHWAIDIINCPYYIYLH